MIPPDWWCVSSAPPTVQTGKKGSAGGADASGSRYLHFQHLDVRGDDRRPFARVDAFQDEMRLSA
jgi:hypothetical protein